jgi:hypothetical protein
VLRFDVRMVAAATKVGCSTLDSLHSLARETEEAFNTLLDQCDVRYHDINDGGGVFYVGWSPHRWKPLEPAAQRLVGQAARSLERFTEMGTSSICAAASERLNAFVDAGEVLERIVRQDDSYRGAPAGTVDGVREVVRVALAKQLAVLDALPSAQGDGGLLLVPDTNALLFKPELESWEPPTGDWTIVLVPQVIRELDSLKSRSSVGEKANGAIRRIKEYSRRGDTFNGVPLAKRLSLREIPIDADMSKAPSWLRAGHGDDELLASLFELRWADLQASVVLATRDRNLQNKARFGWVSYLDVEDEL